MITESTSSVVASPSSSSSSASSSAAAASSSASSELAKLVQQRKVLRAKFATAQKALNEKEDEIVLYIGAHFAGETSSLSLSFLY